MPKSLKELKHFTTESPHVRAEKKGRRIMSQLLGVFLMKKKLEISGGMQEFHLVNEQEKIVGDVKRYVTKTTSPTSEIDRMSAYVWFMEKLEQSSRSKWRKIFVGLGNRCGEGSQVDLLLLAGQHPALCDRFVRWILVDGTKPKGSNRYVIFNNKQAKNATMGGVRKGKQNNLRVNDLLKHGTTREGLLEEIAYFLTS